MFTRKELNCLSYMMGGEDISDWNGSEEEYHSILKKLKDNPVPSIVIKIEEDEPITRHQLAGIRDSLQDVLQKTGWYNWSIKLQNGVETDKEGPKNEDGYTMVRCAACGKYHTPICSDDCACALL